MRLFVIGVCGLIAVSCREIQPVTVPVTISGYQITGKVTAFNGTWIDSVMVNLHYNYMLYGTAPIDTQNVYVNDPTDIVDISVYNSKNVYMRNLYLGFRPVGVIRRPFWDGRDDNGRPVPSGKYNLRYTVGSAIAKQSTVIIDGHPTVVTDLYGDFTITNDYLPVGEIFDYYDSTGTYRRTNQVLSTVILEFTKFNLNSAYSVNVAYNQITNGVFVIE